MLARINDNSYRLPFHGKYNVSGTFNVSNLSPFDTSVVDSRTNPLKRERMMERYEKTQKRLNLGLLEQV